MHPADFNSPEEELNYWRNLALSLEKSLQETKDEFEEFQENSKELEIELETQLIQAETRGKDLTSKLMKLQIDYDNLRDRFDQVMSESHKEVSELQTELNQIKCIKDGLLKYVRELEQANDDLERAKRATVASLEMFETKLNDAIERNAILESELDEKEQLKEMVQRLKDESRDLRQELQIRNRSRSPESDNNNDQSPAGKEDPNKFSIGNNFSQPRKGNCNEGLLPSSSKISALNIVGDLLRKVGALESKLASYKSNHHEPQTPTGSLKSDFSSIGWEQTSLCYSTDEIIPICPV